MVLILYYFYEGSQLNINCLIFNIYSVQNLDVACSKFLRNVHNPKVDINSVPAGIRNDEVEEIGAHQLCFDDKHHCF